MDLSNVPIEVIGGTVVGAPMFWVFITRIMERISNSKVQIEAARTQIEVIKMLRDEVERLSIINQKLIETLQAVQIENTKMRTELAWVHETTNDMHQSMQIIKMRKTDEPYEGKERRKSEVNHDGKH